MAINLIPEPTGGAPVGIADYNYQNALQQALHGLNEYNNILTEWDTTTEPEIAVGARFIHDGGLYECQGANEAIAGAPADGHVYIKATEAAGVITVSFVTSDAGYTFDPIKGGWYHADGTQLLPYLLLKYDSTSWKKAKPIIANFNEASGLSSCQIYPHAAMETIIQDDTADSIPLPANITLWDFSSPNLINSAGIAPKVKHNVNFGDYNNAQRKWSNRGTTQILGGYITYNHQFANEMIIAFRLYPKFNYNDATNITIFDTRIFNNSNDNCLIIYHDGISKLLFLFQRTTGQNFLISSNAYANNAAFQIPHDIYIKLSEANDNIDVWINNVKQDGISAGTKTKTGTIAGIVFNNKTAFTLGASTSYIDYSAFANTDFYIQDLIMKAEYTETYLTNYDGSANTKPYYLTTWYPGYKHNFLLDNNGNAGFNNLCAEKLVAGSIDIGAGQVKMKKICIGVWNMDATATIAITHYLDPTKIIMITVRILPDAGITKYNDLNYLDTAGNVYVNTATTINLNRAPGGVFDTVEFDDAAINRGYIFIIYEV